MNATLRQVMEQARTWSPADQADLADYARVIEARRSGVYSLDAEERAAIGQAIDEIRQGQALDEDAAFDGLLSGQE